MANLIQQANDLEYVPKDQLIQMSQNPDNNYPSYLVLAEIQRRTQNEKAYAAQQPQPETTVSEELVQEFAGQQGLQGAMAQSPGPQNAFPPSDMSNMAPPSPQMGMPSQQMMDGGLTGYAEGGITGYASGGMTPQMMAEAQALGINIQGLSETQIQDQINKKNTERNILLFGNKNPSISNTNLEQKNIDLLNLPAMPTGLQGAIDAANEPSGFDNFVEGGTQFFFGDERPDAKYPNLARATDEPMDALNYIAPLKGLQLGAQSIKAARAAKIANPKKIDDVIDLTGQTPIRTAGSGPGPVVPRTGTPAGGTPVGGTPAVIPRAGGAGGAPAGGPQLALPNVANPNNKGLMSKALDWLKNNKGKATALFAVPASIAMYSGDEDGDGDGGGTTTRPPTKKEIEKSMDPLDLVKLGGIIMAAKNTSELGAGIAGLAGDMQESKYKKGLLKSKEEQMTINKINAISKALENMLSTDPQYAELQSSRNYLITQLNSGIAASDPLGLLTANIDNNNSSNSSNSSNNSTQSTTNLGGSLGLSGTSLSDSFINPINQKKKSNVAPNTEVLDNFIKNMPNQQFLTGNSYIDNIMRIESGGKDSTNKITNASGPMQVKPATLLDPGYNIVPASDDSVEERLRVGADYALAMRDLFNDDLLGTLAYNFGPGNTQKWIDSGTGIKGLKLIESSDGRPIGQNAIDYVVKAYGEDVLEQLG